MLNAPVAVVAPSAKRKAVFDRRIFPVKHWVSPVRVGVSLVACAFACLGVSGCSSKKQLPIIEHVTEQETNASRFEVITPEAQALDAVSAARTTFVIAPAEDIETWARAKMFLSRYTKDGIVLDSHLDHGAELANFGPANSDSDKPAQDIYRYKIVKQYGRGGIKYHVTCTAAGKGATPQLAERNAKNAARFLLAGMLERSLLAE